MNISIVIATFNRARLLGETLESLSVALEDSPHPEVEVIVINNRSTDATPSVASGYSTRIPSFRLIEESQQGLSYARNRGVEEASGDIVVFLDDDVELEPRWLEYLIAPFENADVGVVGGKVLPYQNSTIPAWLPRRYSYLASVFDPRDDDGPIEKVMGANFAVRRDACRSSGGFDVNLGRKGTKLLGGEEVALFNAMRARGMCVWYAPGSVVRHKIDAKLKPEYIEDYAYWLGVSESYLDRRFTSKLKWLLKQVRSRVFPWVAYPFERMRARTLTDWMLCVIRREYARGYRNGIPVDAVEDKL
ncbi:glycosyltransferase family 2 protein [Nitrogeniibacter aestuarii]|uniref:glycosyltransferase family 2 protein n=1 Tax=Nitrogeniibacter aestuarii TaxID=2815343 RepID=UPI001D12F1B2|nr:glycosyltransferase family 2 protein [Nitrogeniibacter aestuarii]